VLNNIKNSPKPTASCVSEAIQLWYGFLPAVVQVSNYFQEDTAARLVTLHIFRYEEYNVRVIFGANNTKPQSELQYFSETTSR